MTALKAWAPLRRTYWDPGTIQDFHGISSHSPTTVSFVAVRPTDAPHNPVGDLVALPEPACTAATVPLRQVLLERRSSNGFRGDMTQEEIGSLLGLAAGETGRTTFAGQEISQLAYPTAGAACAVSLHVWIQGTDSDLDGALWRYIPQRHGLAERRPLPLQELEQCFAASYSGRVNISHISLMCLITLRLDILSPKYGARAYRLGHLEAGHLAQNLLLTACAEGRASVPWGGFFDQLVTTSLALPSEEVCTYAVPIG